MRDVLSVVGPKQVGVPSPIRIYGHELFTSDSLITESVGGIKSGRNRRRDGVGVSEDGCCSGGVNHRSFSQNKLREIIKRKMLHKE